MEASRTAESWQRQQNLVTRLENLVLKRGDCSAKELLDLNQSQSSQAGFQKDSLSKKATVSVRVCVAPTVHKLAMEDHIYPVEVIGYVIHFVQELLPHPRLGGPKNWVPDSPNFEFLGKFHKTKVQWRP